MALSLQQIMSSPSFKSIDFYNHQVKMQEKNPRSTIGYNLIEMYFKSAVGIYKMNTFQVHAQQVTS